MLTCLISLDEWISPGNWDEALGTYNGWYKGMTGSPAGQNLNYISDQINYSKCIRDLPDICHDLCLTNYTLALRSHPLHLLRRKGYLGMPPPGQ